MCFYFCINHNKKSNDNSHTGQSLRIQQEQKIGVGIKPDKETRNDVHFVPKKKKNGQEGGKQYPGTKEYKFKYIS